MIRPVQDSLANLASAWVSGIAALFLAIGTTGSLTPISPTLTLGSGDQPPGDRVLLEQEFAPPPADPHPPEEPLPAQTPAVAEVEIAALCVGRRRARSPVSLLAPGNAASSGVSSRARLRYR